jgi:MFS transporter, DHA1 family, multidrug resistance protein
MTSKSPPLSATQSRRNVLASAGAAFAGFTGFTIVMPFLPLYIQQLGVEDTAQVAMWSGLTLAATPAVTAISAPLWGRVGDRYGSKLLVLRSLLAFVFTKAAMAFVTAPWQLFGLRALLGVFAGYGALTVSMAAESVPRDEMPRAIGLVQMGQRLGPAVGPILGGVLAPLVGIRSAFLVTAGCYLLSVLLIAIFYREPHGTRGRSASRSMRSVFTELVRTPGFVLLMLVIFALQTVDRSFGPILPLYVAALGIAPSRVATIAGLLFSIAAIFAALGHRITHGLMTTTSPRLLVLVSALSASAGISLALAWPAVWSIAVALMVSGVGIGVGMTAAYSVAGGLLPSDAHVTGFGLLTTASLIGLAVSPIIAGFLGASGLRVVFEFDVVLLLLLAIYVAARMRPTPVTPHQPVVSDASLS